MRVIGLMAGTSLDGIEAVLVNIDESENQVLKMDLLAWESIIYPEELKASLTRFLPPNRGSIEELA